MDAPVVIILGAETFQPELSKDDDYDEIRLMYVALTRAREVLVILYSGDGGLVPNLIECMNKYNQYREHIIGGHEGHEPDK